MNFKFNRLMVLAILPCLAWGMVTWLSTSYLYPLKYPSFVEKHQIYRLAYILRTVPVMIILLEVYRKFTPEVYQTHHQEYIACSLLALVCLIVGFFVKNKFWNYLLDGCLVSPLLEELIARFSLYQARKEGLKTFLLVSILSSLTFTIMHFGYSNSLPSLSVIFSSIVWILLFSLGLCTVFWFRPSLLLCMAIHAYSNMVSIVVFPEICGIKFE